MRIIKVLALVLMAGLAVLLAIRFYLAAPVHSSCTGCNILLISVDTLRADHMGTYGYPMGTTPEIDQFFSDGTVFTNAFTPTAQTIPSFISLFTGWEPQTSRIRNTPARFPAERHPLSSILKEAGFTTAAVVSNPALRDNHFHYARYFDFYDDKYSTPERDRRGIPRLFERRAVEATDVTLRWLEQRQQEKPFFLWTHYMDPHGAYLPPESAEIDSAKYDGLDPLWIAQDKIQRYLHLPRAPRRGKEVSFRHYIRQYDREILSVDSQLKRLFMHLEKSGLLENTIIIFHADHGEDLGENGHTSHGRSLQPGAVRIPLMFRFPPRMNIAPSRHSDLTLITDLFPTILDLAGVNHEETQGISLIPVFIGGRHGRKELFLEMYRRGSYRKTALLNSHLKVARHATESGIKEICHDILNDPDEKWSVSCNSAEARQMLSKVEEHFGNPAPEPTQPQRSRSEVDALKSLGYLN